MHSVREVAFTLQMIRVNPFNTWKSAFYSFFFYILNAEAIDHCSGRSLTGGYWSGVQPPRRYHDWIFSTAESSGKVWNACTQSILSRDSMFT